MDQFPLKIFDDLYGLVHLNKAEKEIIDSPYFQRLRGIKQLGLANLVFPGAEHTRFSHSIGVLWVMDRICRHLGPELKEIYEDRFKEEIKHLRMAALLHDIGHFPLSHTIEAVYESIEEGTKEETAKQLIAPTDKIVEETEPEAPRTARNKRALHERIGKMIIENTDLDGGITRILENNEYNPRKIGPIIVGQSDNFLFNQLMHSDLDADQMDYLLRDAKNTGIRYGEYEIDYLVECFHLVRKDIDGALIPILCVREKGIHTVEHYVLAKYFYFTQILYHRTRLIFENIAGKIFKESLQHEDFGLPSLESLKGDYFKERTFLSFDDLCFQKLLERSDYREDIESLAEMILFRRNPETVFDAVMSVGPNDNMGVLLGAKQKAEEIVQHTNHTLLKNMGLCISNKDIFEDYKARLARSELSEDEFVYKDPESIKIFTGKRNIEPEQIKLLKDCSAFLSRLEGLKTYFIRVYR